MPAGGQRDMMKITIAFRRFTNAPKTALITAMGTLSPTKLTYFLALCFKKEFMICTPTTHHILLN